METIKELETYLEKECYSFREITIGKHFAYEGIIIEKVEEHYIFACSERGRKEVLKSFSSEKELVDYAFLYITKEKWFRSHLVAWVWNRTEIEQAEAELRKKNIAFERNDIRNYAEGQNAYRIFVFGRDCLHLKKFKKKYLKC